MKKVYGAQTLQEAHIIKDVLEQAGIAAEVRGRYLAGALGELPITEDTMPSVWVEDQFFDQAQQIIEESKIPDSNIEEIVKSPEFQKSLRKNMNQNNIPERPATRSHWITYAIIAVIFGIGYAVSKWDRWEIDKLKIQVQQAIDAGRYQDALDRASGGLKLDPESRYFASYKAIILLLLNQCKESQEFALDLIADQQSPNYGFDLRTLSYSLACQSKYDSALRYMKRANKKNGGIASDLSQVGFLHISLSQFDQAERVFDDSLEKFPNNPWATYGNSIVNFYTGKKSEGLKGFKKSLNLLDKFMHKENDPTSFLELKAMAHTYIQEYDLAKNAIASSLDRNPDNPFGIGIFGLILHRLGKTELALKQFEKAIQISPDYDYNYYLKALIEYETKKIDSSLQTVEKAIDRNPKDFSTWYLRGLILLEKQDWQGASESLSKSTELNRNFTASKKLLAFLQENQNPSREKLFDLASSEQLDLEKVDF